MTETWNFINTGSHDPYYNMAMDEALLNFVSKEEIDLLSDFTLGILHTLSVGYFQKIKRKKLTLIKNEKGFGLVRRQTGGRGSS